MKVFYDELIKSLPAEYNQEIGLNEACQSRTLVILDDDPTGCQTVHDVPVLFSWEAGLLEGLLKNKERAIFIITNTRSMTESAAVSIVEEVMKAVMDASRMVQREVLFLSRSDSTLRGHYPAELNAMAPFIEGVQPMHCLIPAFFRGGRYTCNDIHYVREGDILVPAAETPFARDKAFAFSNSDLKAYVEEKTEGNVCANEVLSFTIEELRKKGPEFVRIKLMEAEQQVCIVNAVSQRDLDVFAVGAWEAILRGKLLLFRSAASIINSLVCIQPKEVLGKLELRSESRMGGLIVVGSYVPKSSAQLNRLLEEGNVVPLEIHVKELLERGAKEEVSSWSQKANQAIQSGRTALVYTSRELVHTDDAVGNLEIGNAVSGALVELVKNITKTPAFILTKGGITSHDIAVRGLGLKSTRVIGQALPGVPVIVSAENPGMKYIIFPGNVGNEDSLLELYRKLTN